MFPNAIDKKATNVSFDEENEIEKQIINHIFYKAFYYYINKILYWKG